MLMAVLVILSSVCGGAPKASTVSMIPASYAKPAPCPDCDSVVAMKLKAAEDARRERNRRLRLQSQTQARKSVQAHPATSTASVLTVPQTPQADCREQWIRGFESGQKSAEARLNRAEPTAVKSEAKDGGGGTGKLLLGLVVGAAAGFIICHATGDDADASASALAQSLAGPGGVGQCSHGGHGRCGKCGKP